MLLARWKRTEEEEMTSLDIPPCSLSRAQSTANAMRQQYRSHIANCCAQSQETYRWISTRSARLFARPDPLGEFNCEEYPRGDDGFDCGVEGAPRGLGGSDASASSPNRKRHSEAAFRIAVVIAFSSSSGDWLLDA